MRKRRFRDPSTLSKSYNAVRMREYRLRKMYALDHGVPFIMRKRGRRPKVKS